MNTQDTASACSLEVFINQFTYTKQTFADSGKESPGEDPAANPQASSGAPDGQDPPAPHGAPASHPAVPKSGLQCIAVLPGLGVYTDSSDSDNNVDSDSDEDDDVQSQVPQQPRDITGRIVKPVAAQCGGQQGC